MHRCEIPKCRNGVDLRYLGHGICSHCWDEFTRDEAPPDALRMALGIAERGPEADREKDMSDQTSSPAEAGTKEEIVKSKKTAKAKGTKAAKPTAPAKKVKASGKREPKEKVELRTVAMRIPEEEFQLLHKAAGPRNLAGF